MGRLVLNLSHAAIIKEDSKRSSRTAVDTPAFSTNMFLEDIGGAISFFQDDFSEHTDVGDVGDAIYENNDLEHMYS